MDVDEKLLVRVKYKNDFRFVSLNPDELKANVLAIKCKHNSEWN